jgi:hypothetical protein
VPQTLLLYETAPLFLVPRTLREAALPTVLSYAGIWWLVHQPLLSAAHRLVLSGQMEVVLLYLPSTLMVLRRPNQGPMPAWLERCLTRPTLRTPPRERHSGCDSSGWEESGAWCTPSR